jgi:HEAT repeat protein
MKFLSFVISVVLFNFAFASVDTNNQDLKKIEELNQLYKTQFKDKNGLSELKSKSLLLHNKAVPTLITVMKDSQYPDENRWIATFLLGQIMGVKSAPFIAKFVAHPHWMMRLASLKTLLALKQNKYHAHYAQALKDPSLLVRYQALENIEKLKIKELGPNVWKMLYNKDNYSGKEGKLKRAAIIKNIIRTIGEIEFKQAEKPLVSMSKNPKFKDLHSDLKYSISKLSRVN